MHDDLNARVPPEEVLAIDRLVAGLGRFSPRPGFENRVLRGVRIPLPRWARAIRSWLRGITSGITGWIVLGTASLATAAMTAVAIGTAVYFQDYVTHGVSVLGSGVLAPAWDEVLRFGPTVRSRIAEVASADLGGTGFSWKTVLLVYGAVALGSAVALRFLTRPAGHKG